MCHDFLQQGINGVQELLAEVGPLLLVPQIRFLDICGGCGGGPAIASLGAAPNPTEHLVPWDAERSLALELIQPPVRLLPLGLGEWDRVRRSRETFPKLIQEAKSLLETKTGNVDCCHAVSIPQVGLDKLAYRCILT